MTRYTRWPFPLPVLAAMALVLAVSAAAPETMTAPRPERALPGGTPLAERLFAARRTEHSGCWSTDVDQCGGQHCADCECMGECRDDAESWWYRLLGWLGVI